MDAPLRLRPAADHAAPAAGYVIPSPDPAVWADELMTDPAAAAGARLYVLPMSANDVRPSAAFVTVNGTTTLGPRCQPYVRKGDRVFYPADGRLDPDFGAAEIDAKLSGDLLVLHPTLGLVGFASGDALRLTDLFATPEVTISPWDRARPGVRSGKLTSIEPFPPPELETIFTTAGGDIGTDSPDELAGKSGVGDAIAKGLGAGMAAAGAGMAALGGLFGSLAKLIPGGGSSSAGAGRGFFKSFQQWLSRKGADLANLQQRRNRAIEQLVEMLRTNPDRGLKFALPIGGLMGRGLATPSANLSERNVNFSLGGVFGGSGPVDAWQLRYDLQRRLDDEYRRLARREAELGRYRRAAYIYAQLLADHLAAAAVLKEGRHFHEAAVLYERRLGNKREAALCYEQAGAIDKAVEMYTALKDHETAGDLLTRVGRTDEGKAAYHVAASRASDDGDDLKAADIYEHKLHDIEQAADLLELCWPRRKQAVACARKLLEVTGRTGDSGRAQRFLARIDEPTPSVNTPARAELLIEAFEKHPSETVRDDASRRAWGLMGRELPTGGIDEPPLLRLLPRLAPTDRLLPRDAAYYPTAKRIERAKPGQLVREWELLALFDARWTCIQTTDFGFFALGNDDGGYAQLVRGDWNGNGQVIALGVSRGRSRPSSLAVCAGPELLVLLSTPRTITELPAYDKLGPAVPVRFLDGDKPFTSLAVGADDAGRVWMLNGRHLHRYDSRFRFERSFLIDREEPWADAPMMAAAGETLFLSDGASLYMHRNGAGGSASFPPVFSMATTAGYTAPMVAFGLPGAVAFGRADAALKDYTGASVRDIMEEPIVGFARDGRLVASDGKRAVVFRESAGNRRLLEFDVGLGPLKTIVPTPALHEIAFFAQSGEVRVYSLGS